jgi:hypothetical protein
MHDSGGYRGGVAFESLLNIMAVHIIAANPQSVLQTFKKAIDDKHIVTWSYDASGDFTHTTSQWENLAWLRPVVKSDRLVLNIIRPKGLKVSSEVYAIYHGRFIEAMLAHCDKLFTNGVATAMPETGDLV